MPLGEKLRKLRKVRNWSQDILGQKLGIHGRHIGKYETGKVMPGAETLMKIAKLFDVAVDYLLFDDSEAGSAKIMDKSLLREFEVVDQMAEEDKNVIKSLIDAYIKKHQLEKILQAPR